MTKAIYADKDESHFPHSQAVLDILNNVEIDILRKYQREPELTNTISNIYKLHPNQVFLEAGIIGIIHRVLDYSNKKRILLPTLGYPYYEKLAKHLKYKITRYNFLKKHDKFSYDIKDILRKVTKTDILVLIDPESPLGFSLPIEDLTKILNKAPKSTLVIMDQAHYGFRKTHQKDISNLVKQYPNLLVARNFSKLYGMAGLRIAYALHGQDVRKMINFKERYLGFNRLSQKLAIAALNSKDHYFENAKKIRDEKQKFINKLSSYFKLYKTDTEYVLVQVPNYCTELIEKLSTELNIHIKHLKEYHSKLDNLFRITICQPKDNGKIIDLFESVGWFMGLNIVNTEAKNKIYERKEGYFVNRVEVPCEKSKLDMGIHRVIIPPGKLVSPHKHPEQDELFEFFSNSLFILNGKEILTKPGQWINVKPGQSHSIQPLNNTFARFIPLRFPYQSEKKQGIYNPSE